MKILLPVDGSRWSKAAIRFVAARFAHARKRPKIELLNVQPPIPARPARFLGAQTVRAYHAEESRTILEPARSLLTAAGLQVRVTSVVGHPGKMVSDAAGGADLVIMGAHGRGAVAGLLFGSVTNTVLASCSTPLLILRGQALSRAKPATTPRLGVAIDGSARGLAALRYAIKHRDLLGRVPHLTLIHVVPDLLAEYMPGLAAMPMPMFSPEQAAQAQETAFESAVTPARKLLKRAGVTAAEVRLVGNAPGDAIAGYAKENRLDFLVMGSHGHGALSAVVLGSVTTRVAARCDIPLLVIRAT